MGVGAPPETRQQRKLFYQHSEDCPERISARGPPGYRSRAPFCPRGRPVRSHSHPAFGAHFDFQVLRPDQWLQDRPKSGINRYVVPLLSLTPYIDQKNLAAIGVTNTVGTVFSAMPATGSFSRSALKSKCGVRTPAAGWVTGVIVIVALYGLTDAFFFIPTAGLSAIIIHAVADLVTPPSQVYTFWRISPLEFGIWATSVLVSVFSTIEYGIYASMSLSLILLLVRVAKPGGDFLGRVKVRSGDVDDAREVFVPFESTNGAYCLNFI